MKFYLTSVASCLDQIESFKNLINQTTKVVILPFSYHKDYINCSEDVIKHFDRDIFNQDSIFWDTSRPFIDAGIDPNNIIVVNPYTDPLELIKYKITRPNTIVYLPGGYPENIVANIYKFGLYPSIRYCHVIVGESAGSMAPFANFFVYKDNDYNRYERFKGIHLLSNATVIPHFRPDNKDIMSACARFHKYSPQTKIYCIEDGGYIVIDNGKIIDQHKAQIYKKVIRKITKKTKRASKFYS
jgi:peptidase E